MRVDALLDPRRIALSVSAADRDAVIEHAARLLTLDDATGAGAHLDADRIAYGLLERERLAPTAIGRGVAIPHTRIDGIASVRCAFLRLESPVDFGAADGAYVDLVFAMLVPDQQVQDHLSRLADIAERFADARIRAALRDAATGDDVLAAFVLDPARRVA